MKTDRGTLFVFSGPSGTGKGTILNKYFEKYNDENLMYSVSATTRSPRDGEIDGVNYHFKSKKEFQDMIDNNEFLEWTTFCDNFYGTPQKEIESKLSNGIDVILEIETVGAFNIKAKCPDAVMIFVLPPSLSELKRRLKGRGTETQEVLDERFAQAKKEIELSYKYDYIILNDTLAQAVKEFRAILTAQRLKTINNNKTITEVLEK